MTNTSIRFAANCTFLFTELPLLERPRAARDAGFDAIELWWPFETATAGDREQNDLIDAVLEAEVQLVGLNFFGGDLAGPDCGIVSWPGREQEFRDSVESAMSIGERLSVPGFNALYGNRLPDTAPEYQDELAQTNLAFAADAVARIGAQVFVEPISGPKPYPLRTATDVARVLAPLHEAGHANVGLLLDIFHLASNGDDVGAVIREQFENIRHVQIADVPGRGEPGSGTLPLDEWLNLLTDLGYGGWTGLEYKPTGGNTIEALGWLPRASRAADSAIRAGKGGDVR